MAYEQLVSVSESAQSGYVATSDGQGGYSWAAQQGGGGSGWDGEGAVRYDEEQSLDDSQKLQACNNISALPGKTVYFWTDGPNTNNIWAILVYGGTGVVKNGDGNAPDGMTFPAFIVCGGITYGKRDFSVFDAGGAIWQGQGNLQTNTIEGINRVDLSLGVTGAAVGQTIKVTAVDANGRPTAWEAVDIPAGLPDVTAADNGKFLRVVNGAWAAETVPSAGGETF